MAVRLPDLHDYRLCFRVIGNREKRRPARDSNSLQRGQRQANVSRTRPRKRERPRPAPDQPPPASSHPHLRRRGDGPDQRGWPLAQGLRAHVGGGGGGEIPARVQGRCGARYGHAAGSWAGPLHNISFVHLSEEAELPEYLRPVVHFRQLRAQCKDHHRRVRAGVKAERRSHKSHGAASATRDENSDLGVSHARQKRWVLNELLILPGTHWCGNEDMASSYSDLSGFVGADSCCRTHDMCPVNIHGLTRKYGIYNSRLTTISHCACDERFRACLRKSKTGASNMVGTVFFDVVKTRCFVFKMEKTCKKWSWWGRCEKYGMEKVASLRDPIPWSS
nr:group 3 secretory phospholipase A2-like [Penaeus vannamei]